MIRDIKKNCVKNTSVNLNIGDVFNWEIVMLSVNFPACDLDDNGLPYCSSNNCSLLLASNWNRTPLHAILFPLLSVSYQIKITIGEKRRSEEISIFHLLIYLLYAHKKKKFACVSP